MKSIAVVNTSLPTIDGWIKYSSDESLIDYDIILIDPRFYFFDRIQFSGGGSCLSIESGRSARTAIDHWKGEIRKALEDGKTVYFVLNSEQIESVAVSSTTPRKDERLYQTTEICSYDLLPTKLSTRNARGSKCQVQDSRFRALFDTIKDMIEYRVILDKKPTIPTLSTKDGRSWLGGILKFENLPGHLVLLPYFEIPEFSNPVDDDDASGEEIEGLSHTIVRHLIAIDQVLQSESELTPEPAWLEKSPIPDRVTAIDKTIATIDSQIEKMRSRREESSEERLEITKYRRLLYESGRALEEIIEQSLRLLGYQVENLRLGSLEIDHVIISPTGQRMVGEAEGKDNSAVGISKFRQLESNINEDFDRDEIDSPAKGVLFGNGFRLTDPADRPGQFTDKCLTNAARLGTALVETCQLYEVVVRILNLDDPEDYISRCRAAIEGTSGAVVDFPES